MMFICLNSPELSGRRVNSFILIDTDREDLTIEFAQSSIWGQFYIEQREIDLYKQPSV